MKIKTYVERLIEPSTIYGLMPPDLRCAHVWGVNHKENGILWTSHIEKDTVVCSQIQVELIRVGDEDTFNVTSVAEVQKFSMETNCGNGFLPDEIDMGMVMYRNVLQHYLKITYPDHDIKVFAMDHVKMQLILQTPDRFELRRYDLYEGNLEIVGMPLTYWLI